VKFCQAVEKLPYDKTRGEAFVTGVLVPVIVKGFFRNYRQRVGPSTAMTRELRMFSVTIIYRTTQHDMHMQVLDFYSYFE
jgi:hypothetical protein